MCVDICIHDTGEDNPHAHIMATVRPLNLDGTWQKTENFIHAVRKFMGIETLSGPLLRELIDHIDVYHIEVTAIVEVTLSVL